MASADAVLALGDKVVAFGLPGWLTSAWPFVLLFVFVFDRFAHALIEPDTTPPQRTVEPSPFEGGGYSPTVGEKLPSPPIGGTGVITQKLKPCIAAFLCLSLAGCGTLVDLQRGTLATSANSTNVTMNWHGNYYHHDTHDVAIVIDAAGRFVGSVAGGVAEALISSGVASAVKHGATNGVQLIAAAVPQATRTVANRRTNRATPAPKIIKP